MTMRLAVVLFNLGGPDRPEAVEPFLFNLFNDAAIIGLPGLLRRPLARVLARRRSKVAEEIYAHLGGRSPLLELTQAQAQALEGTLLQRGLDARVFVCMRYWHPMSDEVAAAVAAFAPDEVVLLPLYPQFSTTTTLSSVHDWQRAARQHGLKAREHAICCYPEAPGWIAAQVRLVRAALGEAAAEGPPRVLFSAHGLPRRVVARGDPYQWQVERTVAAVVAGLRKDNFGRDDLDYSICYQSRVGPLEWIGPATEAELIRAGRDGRAVVMVPIAFVSEHSETLVELDIEYARTARDAGVSGYVRVPAVGTAPEFTAGLAALTQAALRRGPPIGPADGVRVCPSALGRCPCRTPPRQSGS
jgi:protoporphyrin/coproporphyrin ferrochelatase